MTNTELFCRAYPDNEGEEPITVERRFEHIALAFEPKPNCIECNDFSILHNGVDLGDLAFIESFTFAECVELGNTMEGSYIFACIWQVCNNLESLESLLSEMYNV